MRELLTFLYQFYEQGDYAHKSLNDFFETSSTKWDDVKSIRDIRSRIINMVKYKQIETDGDMELFKNWGEINQGQTFDYKKNPLSAVIIEKGINIIEHIFEKERERKIDGSLLKTNCSIQKLNTETVTFYNKQKRYNNVQKWLTFSIVLSTAAYTIFSILNYNVVKSQQPSEQRLINLESELQRQENSLQTFQDAVKDSLATKKNK